MACVVWMINDFNKANRHSEKKSFLARLKKGIYPTISNQCSKTFHVVQNFVSAHQFSSRHYPASPHLGVASN